MSAEDATMEVVAPPPATTDETTEAATMNDAAEGATATTTADPTAAAPLCSPDSSAPIESDDDDAAAAAAPDEEQRSEAPTEAPPAAAATIGSSNLDALMDGEDELAAEAAINDVEATGAADEHEAPAAAAAADGGEEGEEEEGYGEEGAGSGETPDTADPKLVATLRAHLKTILANLDASSLNETGVKDIMKQLKARAGKKVLKTHKKLAKQLAKEAAQARLEEVQADEPAEVAAAAEEPAEEEGEQAQEEEDEYVRPPIGDEEEDEEEERTKKSKKRLRKTTDSDEEDYTEKRAPKKSKKDSKGKKSGSAAASSSSTSTGALLTIPLPKSSFVIFQQSERPRMKEEHPDANAGEIQKLILEKWAALDTDSKGEYEQIAAKQQAAYKQALARLKEEDPAAFEAELKARKKSEAELLKGGKKKKSSEYDDDPEDGHDPEEEKELGYFDQIVRGLKSRKQTKSEMSAEDQKAVAEAFIVRMNDAAQADIDAQARGEPAFARLKMLPDVQAQVSKPRVADLLLDEGLLRAITKWLQPEADGSLPNIRLRTTLYSLLAGLNINEQNLQNSYGLGKRVMSLWKDPEETLANKRTLDALIQKWIRPMLGLSTDFNKLAELDEERGREILNRKAMLDAAKAQRNYNPKRALIPQPARFDYAIRPQANRDHDEAEEAMEAGKAKRNEPESRKEALTKRMDKMKRGAATAKPKFRVDITGRASNL